MAGGSVTVAALRHRPRQAAPGRPALGRRDSASAALGPLYARAVEQSVLKNVLADAPVSAEQHRGLADRRRPAVAAGAGRDRARPDPGPVRPPIQGADTPVDLRAATAGTGRRVRAARSGAAGRPRAGWSAGRACARTWSWPRAGASAAGRAAGQPAGRRGHRRRGRRRAVRRLPRPVGPDDPDTEAPGRAMAVVGVYEPARPGRPLLVRPQPGGAGTAASRPGPAATFPAVDDVLTHLADGRLGEVARAAHPPRRPGRRGRRRDRPAAGAWPARTKRVDAARPHASAGRRSARSRPRCCLDGVTARPGAHRHPPPRRAARRARRGRARPSCARRRPSSDDPRSPWPGCAARGPAVRPACCCASSACSCSSGSRGRRGRRLAGRARRRPRSGSRTACVLEAAGSRSPWPSPAPRWPGCSPWSWPAHPPCDSRSPACCAGCRRGPPPCRSA